jgi:hypothetical protein
MNRPSGTTKWPFFVLWGSHEQLAHTSWAGIDPECLVDLPLAGLRLGGLAHMQGTSIGTAEGGGDTDLAVERLAQARPAVVEALRSCRRRRMSCTS